VPLVDNKGNVVTGACYLQIRIRNEGATAEKVEVFVAKIEKESDGIFSKVDNFYPLNLKWRHYNEIFLDRLSPKTTRDCTLAHPGSGLAFCHLSSLPTPGIKNPAFLSEKRSLVFDQSTSPSFKGYGGECYIFKESRYLLHLIEENKH